MKVLDRLGNELKVGDKVAWVATSYGSAYLKIGNITEIVATHESSHEDQHYDYEHNKWIKTGKMMEVWDVTVKADILHPYDLDKRYIARMLVCQRGVGLPKVKSSFLRLAELRRFSLLIINKKPSAPVY